MIPKESINKYETPLIKKNLIPKNNSIQNNKNLQIFCKDLTKINIPNECGWTPLYRTVIAGDISSTNFLLNNGADPNVKCTMGETSLYQAVDMGQIEHVKILLKHGANPNIANDDGISPLHNAVTKKNISIVKILLKYGADPNIKSKIYQQTPLHLAIKNNVDPMILLLLVQFNGSLMDEDALNKKPIDYANSKEMKNTIEKLRFGKENNIIKEKEIQNFQTPKKMTKWTPSNVYSNTIYSQSQVKNLTIEGTNIVLQNPGNIKINIINNNNSKNNSIQMLKKDLFNSSDKNEKLRDNNNKLNDYKEESINEICINSTKTKKDKSQNNININIKEDKENIGPNTNLMISFKKTENGRFSSNQEDNILNKNSNNKTMNFNLKNNIFEISFEKENRNKINFSFSTNTFNNKIKNNYSHQNENKYKENNSLTDNINYNEEVKNKNKIKDSNIKFSIKEEKNNLNSSIKSVIDKDKINDKYLFENIIKKSITKIEIFDEKNELNESISNTIKSDLNEEDSKTKFANEFLCNKPILKNNLTFIKNTKMINMKPSYMIYLNKSSNRIDNKIPKRNSFLSKVKNNFSKNLSFDKKRITTGQINMNKNFKNNIKTRNEKANSISRASLTTLGGSGNEPNSNKSSLWEILNEVNNEKSLYQSFISNNINTEFDNDYEYENNYKYPIYEWLKEIKLHCYYNLFIGKNILSMNNIISNLRTEKYNITKADIERIGIIIPGHIYRIITKLEIDSNKIKEKIASNIIKNKNRMTRKDINITKNTVNFCCGCCILNEEMHNCNKMKKIFKLEQWLSEINMIKYKENFVENGFDFFEYFILQMFSTIPIDDYILKEELKIKEEKDRDIIFTIKY